MNYRLSPNEHCPHCSSLIDGAMPLDGGTSPKPGDITICVYCGGWLTFDENLSHTIPSDDLLADIRQNPVCIRTETTVRNVIRARAV